jgi:hypothetical protein
MAISTPVPPLFEPGAPPPALPLLTSQTDIFYNPLRLDTITAHEELPFSSQTNRHHSVPPPTTNLPRVRFHSLPPRQNNNASEYSDSSLTSLSSDSESDSSSDESEGDEKIPKPPGEAGRPGRGGYTLRIALGWNPEDHKKLVVSAIIIQWLYLLTAWHVGFR